MKKVGNIALRVLVYLLGLTVIAFGINLSKLSGLGISPVSSIPGVLNKITGVSLGGMVIAVYVVLVLCQIVVKRKDFRPVNAFGILVAIVFGLIVDFVGTAKFQIRPAGIYIGLDAEFTGLMFGLSLPDNYFVRLLVLLASILVIGIGVFIYLKPKLVPMPAEGLALAISEVAGKPFGNCKTVVDTSMIVVALLLQMIFMGWFDSFRSGVAVVREGTVLSALCVGQVVKLLNKLWAKLFDKKDAKAKK